MHTPEFALRRFRSPRFLCLPSIATCSGGDSQNRRAIGVEPERGYQTASPKEEARKSNYERQETSFGENTDCRRARSGIALPPGIASYFPGTPPCNLLSATITGYLIPNQRHSQNRKPNRNSKPVRVRWTGFAVFWSCLAIPTCSGGDSAPQSD